MLTVPVTIKKRVEAEVKRCIDLYNKAHKKSQPMPKIRYDIEGAWLGGQANRNENWIRLHPAYLIHHTDDYIKETVPHEVAHVCDENLDNQAMRGFVRTRRGLRRAKRDIHGWSWKRLMMLFGANPNGRCHNYELPDGAKTKKRARYEYQCMGCRKVIELGPKHHKRMQLYGDIFHKGCRGHKLVRVTDQKKPATPVVTPTFTKPKPLTEMKGTKQEQAFALYNKYNHVYDRGRMIDLFINVLGMTKAGASTYYYNCQKMANR